MLKGIVICSFSWCSVIQIMFKSDSVGIMEFFVEASKVNSKNWSSFVAKKAIKI